MVAEKLTCFDFIPICRFCKTKPPIYPHFYDNTDHYWSFLSHAVLTVIAVIVSWTMIEVITVYCSLIEKNKAE